MEPRVREFKQFFLDGTTYCPSNFHVSGKGCGAEELVDAGIRAVLEVRVRHEELLGNHNAFKSTPRGTSIDGKWDLIQWYACGPGLDDDEHTKDASQLPMRRVSRSRIRSFLTRNDHYLSKKTVLVDLVGLEEDNGRLTKRQGVYAVTVEQGIAKGVLAAYLYVQRSGIMPSSEFSLDAHDNYIGLRTTASSEGYRIPRDGSGALRMQMGLTQRVYARKDILDGLGRDIVREVDDAFFLIRQRR
jgi:hypothetical protein